MSVTPTRKLIEVALPLEAINRESAREKSIRHGHPSTLHLWWARRPLAAARAVLFAQLVDDPSSHPDKFPTEEAQKTERDRLHGIIERLVVWENVQDERLLAEAREEILKSTDGNPPAVLDPFAGGGTIPLEAQRLGLEAHASDLNPVAVLINKALIEVPFKFRGQPPVFPGLADTQSIPWSDATGLAADVRAYGDWMRKEAERRIGHLYPQASLPDGTKATVIAWLWARTVSCTNPVCGREVPLISSLDVSKKKGQHIWLRPHVDADGVRFSLATGDSTVASNKQGQGAKFRCWVCDAPISADDVHDQQDRSNKPPARLLCVVTEGRRRREYVLPDAEQHRAYAASSQLAASLRESDVALSAGARGTFGGNAQGRRYGFYSFSDYFTDRQLVGMATFSDLVVEVRDRVLEDALASGRSAGARLADGGADAAAYADAVATYLGLVMSKTTNLNSSVTTWMSDRAAFRETFARQAIPMAWDFAEANPLGDSGGGWDTTLDKEVKVILALPMGTGEAHQADASTRDLAKFLISTDPPYYDNIVYSDLSDFFYVWLRRSLRDIHPDLFGTVLVPKSEELVANPYRQNGKELAKKFFEDGFRKVFARARDVALSEYPVTVFYAFKQSETTDLGEASSGWETLLEGMLRSKWAISATWPMRTEGSGRLIAKDTNALASSIVLALRPRPNDAPSTDRRGLIAALRAELPQALRDLQHGAIAPVDLPQAAIGPGMAVFSRYSSVIESDGSQMTVRSALARINEILDQVLAEQEGDFDTTTRFAIAWYRQHGYTTGVFGEADSLARARNSSVDVMARDEILTSAAGKVALLKPSDLPEKYDVVTDPHTSGWEALHHLIRLLESRGVSAAGGFLAEALNRSDGAVDAELVKELAFLLFSVAEKNGWTKDALSFNSLATSWPDIVAASRTAIALSSEQMSFEFEAAT